MPAAFATERAELERFKAAEQTRLKERAKEEAERRAAEVERIRSLARARGEAQAAQAQAAVAEPLAVFQQG